SPGSDRVPVEPEGAGPAHAGARPRAAGAAARAAPEDRPAAEEAVVGGPPLRIVASGPSRKNWAPAATSLVPLRRDAPSGPAYRSARHTAVGAIPARTP